MKKIDKKLEEDEEFKNFLERYRELGEKYENPREKKRILRTFKVWQNRKVYEYVQKGKNGKHTFYKDLDNLLHPTIGCWVHAIYEQIK